VTHYSRPCLDCGRRHKISLLSRVVPCSDRFPRALVPATQGKGGGRGTRHMPASDFYKNEN
jgi:predicted RNA-binding protein YlxR (DUF448 family)